MTRVDTVETDAEFIEFEFPDEATAERADKVVAFAAHTGGTTRQARADVARIDTIREKLESAGITWEESESHITEDDMWPEWPGDSDDDSEDDDDEDDADEEASPSP